MGTWATDAFGNDRACDWAHTLASAQDLSPIVAALKPVLESGGAGDAGTAEIALAAAETVARLRGHPGPRNAYTQPVDDWVARHRLVPSAMLAQRAVDAVDRIRAGDSALRALWSESADAAAWDASMRDLRARLQAPPRLRSPDPPTQADPTAELIARLAQFHFVVPDIAPDTPVMALYNAALAADALCDVPRTRAAIAQAWQPLAQLGQASVLWDLAVREAKTLVLEGRLQEALAGLEAWRDSPACGGPGMFEMRAAGLCLTGNDLEQSRALRAQACALAPSQVVWQLDEALLEARLGSAAEGRARLAAVTAAGDTAAVAPLVRFVDGILACREGDARATDLLAGAAAHFASGAERRAASWSMLSICCGWWALALGRARRGDEARALIAAVEPILVQSYNASVLVELKAAGLLDAARETPVLPLPADSDAATSSDGAPMRHGALTVVRARGVNALAQVEAYRRAFAAGTGPYPFLIGDARDLERLLDSIAPPAPEALQGALDAAHALDARAWLDAKRPKAARWPKGDGAPANAVLTQFDVATGRLKPTLYIGLVDLAQPAELFVRLGYGDWNACPPPAVHAALHRDWQARFGAEPIALSNDVVECVVARPPTSRDAALALAREHAAYCPDIVEQGAGTTGKLATALLNGATWYFWWD